MGARAEINTALLRQLMINDVKVWTALKKAGDEAVEYWKSNAPVDPDDKEHKLMAGKDFIVHPGDYEGAIRSRMMDGKEGKFVRVQDWDPKAHWIEYGSKHNEAKALCAKTRAYMQSQGYRA